MISMQYAQDLFEHNGYAIAIPIAFQIVKNISLSFIPSLARVIP